MVHDAVRESDIEQETLDAKLARCVEELTDLSVRLRDALVQRRVQDL